jgi:hypothetical protein
MITDKFISLIFDALREDANAFLRIGNASGSQITAVKKQEQMLLSILAALQDAKKVAR